MKIRAGFVSNSSSSSFIVAFPKKPTSESDVLDMLFDGNSGEVRPYDFIPGTPNEDVAKRVFSDVKSTKKATINQIARELESRYFIISGETTPYYQSTKYCSTDHELMDEIIKKENELSAVEKEHDNKIEAHLEKHLGKPAPYAWIGGTNWSTNKPFTQQDIDAYNKYYRRCNRFKKTNKEYIELENQRSEMFRKRWDIIGKMRMKLAKIDAKKFIEDNKGKHIVILSYSDNSGESNLEHGDIFRNVEHVTISHH